MIVVSDRNIVCERRSIQVYCLGKFCIFLKQLGARLADKSLEIAECRTRPAVGETL